MKCDKLPPGTLIVSHWHTKCNNCGQDCNPDELDHQSVLGYVVPDGTEGCGVIFTHITTMYIGDLEARLTKAMRPDLEFIPLEWG